ncbi:MAG: hypothetical protein ACLTV0_09685 [Faecalimonas sp.]
MLKMVDGTGTIGVDMICPLGVSTPQPPNYDRVELEGTGMLVLPNSLDAPLERLELGGKTEQVTTSGAQLFDASKYEGVTKNGVTVTVKDGVITATGTPNINTWIQVFVSRENYQKLFKPENKIYLKTNKSKDCNYDFGIYGAFGSPIIGTIREGNSGRVLPAELPRNDTDFYFFINVKIGTELKGSIKPIVYHDGDGTWEPYTGGKPSPSPEYPQEIKNVGKWNEEKQKYEIDVKVTNSEQGWTEEQTLTLTSDRPITKWDKLEKRNSVYGILYGSKHVVLNGSEEDWVKSSIDNTFYLKSFKGLPTSYEIFCDKLKNFKASVNAIELNCILGNRTNLYICIDGITDIGTLKTWLSENNLEVYYNSKESQFIPLPQSEQNAIRALKTYYPTTVITADGGELDPDIKATYRKEI